MENESPADALLNSMEKGVNGFVHHCLRIACAQLLREAGFQSSQHAAIETLVHAVKNCQFPFFTPFIHKCSFCVVVLEADNVVIVCLRCFVAV